MPTNVYVVFYSMYSHVYQLAEAIAEGAREFDQTEVSLFQVPELMSDVDPSRFRDLLNLAARGNTLDFFKPLDAVLKQMKEEFTFAIDHSRQFEARLAQAKRWSIWLIIQARSFLIYRC